MSEPVHASGRSAWIGVLRRHLVVRLRFCWQDGVFLALAAAAVSATATQAGGSLTMEGIPLLMRGAVDPTDPRAVLLSATLLIGALSLLGPLLRRLPWRTGLAVAGSSLWGLLAVALLQERMLGDSTGLALPAAALCAVFALALLLRPPAGRRPAEARAERPGEAAARRPRHGEASPGRQSGRTTGARVDLPAAAKPTVEA